MDPYFYIAIGAALIELLFLVHAFSNFRYTRSKHKRSRLAYRPKTTIVIPCKGLDTDFENNIGSFPHLDYKGYRLWFVVEDENDPAFAALCRIKEYATDTTSDEIKILVSGKTAGCSQKIHNLLYCWRQIAEDTEIIAFADSDICVKPDWLSHLVYPLRQEKIGISTGYRWFVPAENNIASLALSAINAKVAQLLGNSRLNHAWGGAMAMRVTDFHELGIGNIWEKALSDDLAASVAVRKSGKKVAYVPACLVASYEKTDWRRLFEFGRRQFLITRVYAPKTWLFGLISGIFGVLTFWGSLAAAIFAAINNITDWRIYAVFAFFFAAQFTRAALRQAAAWLVLRSSLKEHKAAVIADLCLFAAWSLLLLIMIVSSAFGNCITWRGIKYKILATDKIVILR